MDLLAECFTVRTCVVLGTRFQHFSKVKRENVAQNEYGNLDTAQNEFTRDQENLPPEAKVLSITLSLIILNDECYLNEQCKNNGKLDPKESTLGLFALCETIFFEVNVRKK